MCVYRHVLVYMSMHAFKCLCVFVFACVGVYVCICTCVFMRVPVCAYEVGQEQEERSIQLDVLFPSMTQ